MNTELFAIKILLKGLAYSDTYINPIIKLVDELIEMEKTHCTEDFANKLESLSKQIDQTI